MRREKEAVFVASDSVFGRDDVKESSDGDGDAVHDELATLLPDCLEVESGHDQGQINRQLAAVGRLDCRAACDHTLGEPSVARRVKRFVAAPEVRARQTSQVRPALDEVVRVRRQKQITVFCREASSIATQRVVVCAGRRRSGQTGRSVREARAPSGSEWHPLPTGASTAAAKWARRKARSQSSTSSSCRHQPGCQGGFRRWRSAFR